MSTIESSNDLRQGLLYDINSKLRNEGISKEDFYRQKHLRVAPGWTVEDFIYARIDFLEVEWKDNKLRLVKSRS